MIMPVATIFSLSPLLQSNPRISSRDLFCLYQNHFYCPNRSISLPVNPSNFRAFQSFSLSCSSHNDAPSSEEAVATETGFAHEGELHKEEHDHFNLENFLSLLELLCITPCAILSTAWIMNHALPTMPTFFQSFWANGFIAWQLALLMMAVAVSSALRRKQMQRIFSSFHSRGSIGWSTTEKIEKLEEEVKGSSAVLRLLSRHLEKLGIRFRVTRKSLKGQFAEIEDLTYRNSETIKESTKKMDRLEKALSDTQNILLAMQGQQEKQLELILAIGKLKKSRADENCIKGPDPESVALEEGNREAY